MKHARSVLVFFFGVRFKAAGAGAGAIAHGWTSLPMRLTALWVRVDKLVKVVRSMVALRLCTTVRVILGRCLLMSNSEATCAGLAGCALVLFVDLTLDVTIRFLLVHSYYPPK